MAGIPWYTMQAGQLLLILISLEQTPMVREQGKEEMYILKDVNKPENDPYYNHLTQNKNSMGFQVTDFCKISTRVADCAATNSRR